MLPIMSVIFVGLGGSLAYDTAVNLPAAYDRLSASGTLVTAHMAECSFQARSEGCDLTYEFHGQSATFSYPQNEDQFRGLAPGAPVPLLIDPSDESVRYTQHDVVTRFNGGFGAATLVGLAIMLAGLGCAAWWPRLRRKLRSSSD